MARLPIAVSRDAPSESPAFTWFAYGSSLDQAAFADWCAQHGYTLPDLTHARPGRLEGFRLAFDVESRFWGGVVASLREQAGEHVEGLLIPLPGSARTLVDHKEGAVSGLYEAFSASAIPFGEVAPLTVVAYRCSPNRRLPQDGPPSRAYLETLIQGGRRAGFTAEYLARLEGLRPGT